jgi:hypothetical protein
MNDRRDEVNGRRPTAMPLGAAVAAAMSALVGAGPDRRAWVRRAPRRDGTAAGSYRKEAKRCAAFGHPLRSKWVR